jgi:ferric-dicitrate binding protein FerR (iron transport regulator)
MKNDDTRSTVDIRATPDESKDTEGLVERLLHAAGHGPEVPADGAARVKEMIRPAWQNQVAARSRQRNRLWLGGIAAAAALIIAVIYLPILRQDTSEPGRRSIIVATIDGTVEVTPPGSRVGVLTTDDAGVEIPRGSLIRTSSASRVAVLLADNRSLRLDVDTEARLDSEASISLDSGAVYIDSAEDPGSGTEVRTALGTAIDIGTQFEVRLEHDTLEVKVREGLVSLTRGEDDFQITQGVTLSVDATGKISTSAITPYDPAWAWTQAIAPPFEIEGKSALAFLDWVSSETGLSVQFADAELELFAGATLLHGTIEGLSPAQTPEAVLPTCGLIAIEVPGALLVRPLDTIPE